MVSGDPGVIQKSDLPVGFELTELQQVIIRAWITHRGLGTGDYLFPSRMSLSPHITAQQYARIIDFWITLNGLATITRNNERRQWIAPR
jgi:hypothetical protein